MPSHQPAQGPGPTGHHNTTSTQTPGPHDAVDVLGPGEPRSFYLPVPEPDKPLVRRRGPTEQPHQAREFSARVRLGEVDQQDPARILRLGRTSQSGDRSRHRITTRTPDEHGQPSLTTGRLSRERL